MAVSLVSIAISQSLEELAELLLTLTDLGSEGEVRQSTEKVVTYLNINPKERRGKDDEMTPLEIIKREARESPFFTNKVALFEECMMTEVCVPVVGALGIAV